MMRYVFGKKCPSGITMFNGRSVHGCGFSVSYMAAQIYRPEENDSLASRRERASERIVIFESMKITLALVSILVPDEIDTSIYHPAYARHARERAGARRRRGTDHA